MRKSEFIIWCAESKETIKKEHPEWSKAMVEAWFRKIAVKIADEKPEFFGEQLEVVQKWR